VRKGLPQSNAVKSIVARQLCSENLIGIMLKDKVVINIDETWLNTTNFTSQYWSREGLPRVVIDHKLN
jgi:hypothetical protein